MGRPVSCSLPTDTQRLGAGCDLSWLAAVVVALGWLVYRLILTGTNLLCLNRRQHSGVFAEPQVLPHLHCAVERLHDVLHDRVSPTPLCPWEGVTLPPTPTTFTFPLTGHLPDAFTVGQVRGLNLLILYTLAQACPQVGLCSRPLPSPWGTFPKRHPTSIDGVSEYPTLLTWGQPSLVRSTYGFLWHTRLVHCGMYGLKAWQGH